MGLQGAVISQDPGIVEQAIQVSAPAFERGRQIFEIRNCGAPEINGLEQGRLSSHCDDFVMERRQFFPMGPKKHQPGSLTGERPADGAADSTAGTADQDPPVTEFARRRCVGHIHSQGL
jgi:hypothetical protein